MFTGTPYGQFDLIQADFDTLSKYRFVFYSGFNLMTPAIARRLRDYVEAGGTVLIAAAHLNGARLPDAPAASPLMLTAPATGYEYPGLSLLVGRRNTLSISG